jgi:transposase
LRDVWLVKLSDFHARQLVFIDESGANERNGRRRNGWAPKGCAAYIKDILQYTKNWSILPAYSIDGYISTVMFKGSINGERFEEFVIEYVLPLCTPFPGRNSVLVMDNASIHKSERLVRACIEAGVLLRYLPPYSPDFNPIEESFSDLKAWIRRHWKHIVDYQDFEHFLQTAISKNGDPTRALAHFKNCYINVDSIEIDEA